MSYIHSFLYTIISTSAPIILAALGGMLTRQVGMFNIGLEGMMTIGAFFSVYFTDLTGSLLLGFLLGCACTILMGLLMAFLSIRLKADIFVVGIAANIFGTGLATFLGLVLTGMQGTMLFMEAPALQNIHIPLIDKIPVTGDFLSGHTIIDYLSIVLVFVIAFVLKRTRFGRHSKAVGINPVVARANSISVEGQRYVSYILCGLLCGMAGAAMSLPIRMYTGGAIGMVNGRGWTAMAIVIISAGNPIVTLIASWVLGGVSAIGNLLQTTGVFPPRLVMAFPFIAAVIATAIFSATKKEQDVAGGH